MPLGICRWEKVFKNGPSKICGRQPLKNFAWSILEYFVPDVTEKKLFREILSVYKFPHKLWFIIKIFLG